MHSLRVVAASRHLMINFSVEIANPIYPKGILKMFTFRLLNSVFVYLNYVILLVLHTILSSFLSSTYDFFRRIYHLTVHLSDLFRIIASITWQIHCGNSMVLKYFANTDVSIWFRTNNAMQNFLMEVNVNTYVHMGTRWLQQKKPHEKRMDYDCRVQGIRYIIFSFATHKKKTK